MLTTTLAKIKNHGPCIDGWKKLLEGLGGGYDHDAPIPLERILEINDLDDALWALRAIEGHDNAIRLYACYCAKYSLYIFERKYSGDKHPKHAIETAGRFAHGDASREELDAARDAAMDAVWGDAWDAVWDAAWAAPRDDAWDAAREAARAAAVLGDAWDDFRKEFVRLCRGEGEYGEVKE